MHGSLAVKIPSTICDIEYIHLEGWSDKEVHAYVCLYAEIYAYLCTERKGHGSLIAEVLM